MNFSAQHRPNLKSVKFAICFPLNHVLSLTSKALGVSFGRWCTAVGEKPFWIVINNYFELCSFSRISHIYNVCVMIFAMNYLLMFHWERFWQSYHLNSSWRQHFKTAMKTKDHELFAAKGTLHSSTLWQGFWRQSCPPVLWSWTSAVLEHSGLLTKPQEEQGEHWVCSQQYWCTSGCLNIPSLPDITQWSCQLQFLHAEDWSSRRLPMLAAQCPRLTSGLWGWLHLKQLLGHGNYSFFSIFSSSEKSH